MTLSVPATGHQIPRHTTESPYDAVFLDFGGVLSPPIDELFLDYQAKTGISPTDLKGAMAGVADRLGVEVLAPVELGLLSEPEWVAGLHSWLIARGVDVSRSAVDFGRQWFAGHQVNSTMRSLALTLRDSGYRVGILTNNVREWEAHWRAMVDLDDHVDTIVDSYDVGVRKPDPAIFALSAERLDVDPTRAILIDDLPENCAAARASGWSAVQFVTNQQTVAQLIGLLGSASETQR
ncbi:HAD family phosphatase [Gordonia sp. VNQ95]|uniref:HAD family hydrolase n=1 Tax=Gordonia sp. VNQ95 TaxID=3156619 RepID=UPI0032B3A0BD